MSFVSIPGHKTVASAIDTAMAQQMAPKRPVNPDTAGAEPFIPMRKETMTMYERAGNIYVESECSNSAA